MTPDELEAIRARLRRDSLVWDKEPSRYWDRVALLLEVERLRGDLGDLIKRKRVETAQIHPAFASADLTVGTDQIEVILAGPGGDPQAERKRLIRELTEEPATPIGAMPHRVEANRADLDGWAYEPSTDDRLPRTGLTPEEQAERPTAAEVLTRLGGPGYRPWTSLPLITAEDGRNYEAVLSNTGYRWRPLIGDPVVRHLTDDEIAALGLVREAVVVTLPDLPWENAQTDENGLVHPGFPAGWMTPEVAKKVAAELLAAARASESGADDE